MTLLIFFIAVLLSTVNSFACHIIDIGPEHRTFKISEYDMMELIKERAKAIDWNEEVKKAREHLKEYKSPLCVTLPPATKHRIRYFVPVFTLNFDIKDAYGNVIYKKGTRYNVLDLIPEPVSKAREIVVFDVNDKEQIKFVKKLLQKKDKVFTLLANCNAVLKDIVKAMKQLHARIYFVDERAVRRLGLEAVPSVVTYSVINGKRAFKIEEFGKDDISTLAGEKK
ncbi:hypothetical protein [Desulfurobacterium sp.]